VRRVAVALVAIGSLIVVTPQLASSGPNWRASERPPDNPQRGVHYRGLEEGQAGSECEYMYEVTGSNGRGQGYCTHGPDPAPPGIDVTRERTTVELVAGTAGEAATAAVDCVGDGTSGKRVEAIYAVASDRTNRYASLTASFPVWAARVDSVVQAAATATGGERHVRWLTSGCDLIVRNVTLSALGDDNIANTMSELRNMGYNRTDRKYLLWVDSNVYCGIATIWPDDSPGSSNRNNGYDASFARVDTPCWGNVNSVEAHELVHNWGGVQRTAPHGTPNFHCFDEYDRLCYDDDGNGPVSMQIICNTSSLEAQLDCNHDDYFNVSPATGSWLASHWNVANSGWLEAAEGSPTTTIPPTTVPPTTTTVAPTTTTRPTRTTTFTGTITSKRKTATHSVSAAAGVLTATVTFSKVNALAVGTAMVKLDLLNASNKVVQSVTGASPLTLSRTVTAGTWKVRITRQSHDVSYSLKVTRT
jgi:hypothetical protein